METNVTFKSADDTVTLAGTLNLPAVGHDLPAVVLVSGTGPIDRDVTILGHRLFLVTAERLAVFGIASLRFDKRGVGESEGDFASAGPDDFVADVLGGWRHLVEVAGFSPGRTGLVGHSEGGMVALTAASRLPRLAFGVLLASPLLTGLENLVCSFALLARGGFQRDAEHDRYAADLATLLAAARGGNEPGQDSGVLALAERLAPRIVNRRTAAILGNDSISGTDFVGMLASPCLDTCLGWDPGPVASQVRCPVLAIYAAMDMQAPARENLAAARALLGDPASKGWELREVAGMNHAFQHCETGMPDEYASIDHVMAGEVIDEVAAWILAQPS